MMEDVVARLRELTDVDIERDSAETESKHSFLHSLLTQFIESEVRSGSMDFGCITPLYVYRMWGGAIPMEDIERGLMELREQGFMVG